jgi:hypothetical protein
MAPMMAAALPPPGVEQGVGAFEQPADAGAMQFQLKPADAERAETDNAVALLALVGGLDAFETERRLRVHIGDRLDGRIVLPVRGLEQLNADGAGGEHDLGAFNVLGTCRLIGALHRLDLDAEARLDGSRCVFGALLRARSERDIGALLRKQGCGAHSDGTGAGEHDGLLALQLCRLGEQCHARRRGRVGAVGIEHHRDAEGAEEFLLHGLEQRLALGHVAAADEDRRVLLVLAAAGEDSAVDQPADIVRRDIGVARHAVRAAVIADDRVEHGWHRVGIEQEQELLHMCVSSGVTRRRSAACRPRTPRYCR